MKPADLRKLSQEELLAKAAEIRKELFISRIKHSTGQFEKTARLSLLKRDVARVETVLREKRGAEQ